MGVEEVGGGRGGGGRRGEDVMRMGKVDVWGRWQRCKGGGDEGCEGGGEGGDTNSGLHKEPLKCYLVHPSPP